MTYLWAFLFGGLICGLSQLAFDKFNLTTAHILVTLVISGAILEGLGIYKGLVSFGGAGFLVPVSGFGSSIARGIISESKRLGWEGLFTGAFELTGLGVTAAVIFGTLAAIFSRPKD
ncbi:MAG: SpoVA/SpoVAEb family sporulation membrane protein [Limnochordia bacterium]|jgi:stage V sporulation protein AE|nr:SpoVA/SpoVAEb family sporulation membrane protein [Limnochordia bacterium]MDD2630591.1 SpoVA/SpoVAEb family sporulation membrane protein [Limnochordia bacterium]MDD4519054.1 SpoVA/SpoVAEb family sporulation membrane protein [Limnochordia bacterium]